MNLSAQYDIAQTIILGIFFWSLYARMQGLIELCLYLVAIVFVAKIFSRIR